MNTQTKSTLVNPLTMILLSLVPFGSIYVLKKLGQFRAGIGLFFSTSAAIVGVQYWFGFPYGIIFTIGTLIITSYIVRYWCLKYNEKITWQELK